MMASNPGFRDEATRIDTRAAREALTELPDGTTSGGTYTRPEEVYLPQSHLRALHPDAVLVQGMRGAGKTFWWKALQEAAVREAIGHSVRQTSSQSKQGWSLERTEVRTGFGETSTSNEYPNKDEFWQIANHGFEPRIIWKTIQSWHLAPENHNLRTKENWPERVKYVKENPGPIHDIFRARDSELDRKNKHFLILFDALDRIANDWEKMYAAIRGLMEASLELRSTRRLRAKVFLRSDQVNRAKIGNFPDASKIFSAEVALNWPRNELYGLLWHNLINGNGKEMFQRLLRDGNWDSITVGDREVFSLPRSFTSESSHRNQFHDLAGPWMGRDRRRGFPYTWIPNHLGDTENRVSPRSFLAALRQAARDTDERYPNHRYALHYESIKNGVGQASSIRVTEVAEDYPWVHAFLSSLEGLVVPCHFNEIASLWGNNRDLEEFFHPTNAQTDAKMGPGRAAQGVDGVRRDIEDLGIFFRMRDGRVNIPDVFRVGFGLGRKGGIRPVS